MEPSPNRPKEQPGSGQRFIQNLAYLAPGYLGYKTPALRQDEDARLRNRVLGYLSDLVDLLKERETVLERLSLEAARAKLQQELKRLERVEKSIRFSPLGFTDFFEQQDLSEACIEKILEKDLILFQDFDETLEMVRGTPFPPPTKKRFANFFQSLASAIERIENGLLSRDRAISNC